MNQSTLSTVNSIHTCHTWTTSKRCGGGIFFLFEWNLKEFNNFQKFSSLKNAYQYLISIYITLLKLLVAHILLMIKCNIEPYMWKETRLKWSMVSPIWSQLCCDDQKFKMATIAGESFDITLNRKFCFFSVYKLWTSYNLITELVTCKIQITIIKCKLTLFIYLNVFNVVY